MVATGEELELAARTVLVVEDEATLRLAVSKALRKKGFSVIDAGDGTIAMDLIRTFGKALERFCWISLCRECPAAKYLPKPVVCSPISK